MANVLQQVGQKLSDKESIAQRVIQRPALLTEVVQGLDSDTARIKFGCAKVLRLISEQRPDLLYPHFDYFVRLLDSPNRILQWEAAFVLSHLARVDLENKFEPIFEKFFAPISGPVMITAANVVRAGAIVVRARPHWADRVAGEILRVARARYQTDECRNVAIGQAIDSLREFFGLIQNTAPMLRFVRRQLKNSRSSTRKKAEQFLKQCRAPLRAIRAQ